MKLIKRFFDAAVLLQPALHADARGWFYESYNEETLAACDIPRHRWVQDNRSLSRSKHTLRGIHLQAAPHGQAKLVEVLCGAVRDIIVDLRRNSPTFGRWQAVTLTAQNHEILYIPEGFGHAFVTTQENTLLTYKCSRLYAPQSEITLAWKDPDLAIQWDIGTAPILSEKDRRGITLKEYTELFSRT
ncbi:MAG: dTDP-4-dehydrorhamnose 3,5-epimerase [Fibrobacterota bacterium]